MRITGRSGIGLRGVVIAALLLVILVVTLTPSGKGSPAPFSFALTLGRRGLADVLLNFLLFLPLGLTIGWNSRSPLVAGLCGLLLATAVELVQTIVPGRDPSLSDIISNTAGTLAGALIARRPRAWLIPSGNGSVALTASSIFAAALLMIATAFLLSPVPASPIWASKQFRLPASSANDPADVRTLLAVESPSAEELIFIARSGNDLLLRYPSRAGAFGLDQPEYWQRGAFKRSASRETDLLSLSRDRARWHIVIGSNRATLGPTVGTGWAVLAYPDAIGRRWGEVLNAAWMFVICFPVGFWARGRLRLGAAVLVVVIVAFVPEISGVVDTSLLEWGGAVVGFLTGASIAASSGRWLSHWVK